MHKIYFCLSIFYTLEDSAWCYSIQILTMGDFNSFGSLLNFGNTRTIKLFTQVLTMNKDPAKLFGFPVLWDRTEWVQRHLPLFIWEKLYAVKNLFSSIQELIFER